jgi:Zn-finger nucleic acid-binding protein
MALAMETGESLDFVPGVGRCVRSCPDCGAEMASARLFGIPIDHCASEHHGVWFDKDELAQFLERVGDEEPAPPQKATSFSSLLRDFFEGR